MNEGKQQEGMALVAVMFVVIVVLGAVALTTLRGHSASTFAEMTINNLKAREVCKAGIDLGVYELWGKYVEEQGGTPGNLTSYLEYLDGVVASSDDPNTSPTPLITQPRELNGGEGRVLALTVTRADDVSGTTLTISATGESDLTEQSATQQTRVAGVRFRGFEFCVLANNINCILCHATFHAQDLEENMDASLYGSYDRIKVGSLESLLVRKGTNAFSANSAVAGTVYTRGSVRNENFQEYSADGLATSSFTGYEMDSATGQLAQDGSGNMISTPFVNGENDPEGYLLPYANLYMNYPTDDTFMTDGELPLSFPAPFPDLNGDRTVNDDEFEPVMDTAYQNASISGGIVYGVPEGATYDGVALPSGSSSNGAAASLASGNYDGNVILVGTEANPIEIDGAVAIDGDLVIAGTVKGWGQINVRNNVYIVGDVTYQNDTSEPFGTAPDGTENGLAVAAGGSIMMGDYLTRRAKDKLYSYDIWSDCFVDVRQTHKTVNASAWPWQQVYKDVGYFDDDVVDPGGSATSSEGYMEHNMSFTASELSQFNFIEHELAAADAGYVPRYYQLRDSAPIYEYTGQDNESTGHALVYNNPYVEALSSSDLARGAIHSLNPADNWLTEDQLRQIWYNDEMSRPDSGRPFEFHGLLYSNNAIFCITRSKTTHNSNTRGQLIVRGGIVTADLGVLVPGWDPNAMSRDGFQMYYDRRVANMLRVEDPLEVEFTRHAFRWELPDTG